GVPRARRGRALRDLHGDPAPPRRAPRASGGGRGRQGLLPQDGGLPLLPRRVQDRRRAQGRLLASSSPISTHTLTAQSEQAGGQPTNQPHSPPSPSPLPPSTAPRVPRRHGERPQDRRRERARSGSRRGGRPVPRVRVPVPERAPERQAAARAPEALRQAGVRRGGGGGLRGARSQRAASRYRGFRASVKELPRCRPHIPSGSPSPSTSLSSTTRSSARRTVPARWPNRFPFSPSP
ncbi:hypothetical protein ACJX0J_015167, partial [Zea mays]